MIVGLGSNHSCEDGVAVFLHGPIRTVFEYLKSCRVSRRAGSSFAFRLKSYTYVANDGFLVIFNAIFTQGFKQRDNCIAELSKAVGPSCLTGHGYFFEWKMQFK